MQFPESLIFPVSVVLGVAAGVGVLRALRKLAPEHGAHHHVYALTVGVDATLWLGFAAVAIAGGGPAQGPVQYSMGDEGHMALFHARCNLTFLAMVAVPASLFPTLALFRKQSADERMIGFCAILALWFWMSTIITTGFFPTV